MPYNGSIFELRHSYKKLFPGIKDEVNKKDESLFEIDYV